MTRPLNIDQLDMVPVPDLGKDQQFELLAIRNQQIVRENSYSSHVIGEGEHAHWIKRLKTDSSLQFYAVMLEGRIVGGVGLRKIDDQHKTADWSFYVSGAEHGRGIGLALGVRALDLFFDDLRLSAVKGEALLLNAASQSYHLKLGFLEVDRAQHLVMPDNKMAEIVIYSLSAADWALRRVVLLKGG